MVAFVSTRVMKRIFFLLSGLAAIPLLTSCADYGVYGTTVARPIVGNSGFVSGGFVSGNLAPLQVGFVATTFDRWAWDPYRRFWFDRSCGRYWDYRQNRYCTVVPRRFPTAVYPTGYRRGTRLACPSYLPRTTVVASRGSHFGNFGRGVIHHDNNRSRVGPVVHGFSRGSTGLRTANSRGRFDPSPVTNDRTFAPTPSRWTVTHSTISPDKSLRNVASGQTASRNSWGSRSTSPPTYSNRSGSLSSRATSSLNTRLSSGSNLSLFPTVRSTSIPTVRSTGSSGGSAARSSSFGPSAPAVRAAGASRSPVAPSRSMNSARQRTR